MPPRPSVQRWRAWIFVVDLHQDHRHVPGLGVPGPGRAAAPDGFYGWSNRHLQAGHRLGFVPVDDAAEDRPDLVPVTDGPQAARFATAEFSLRAQRGR